MKRFGGFEKKERMGTAISDSERKNRRGLQRSPQLGFVVVVVVAGIQLHRYRLVGGRMDLIKLVVNQGRM